MTDLEFYDTVFKSISGKADEYHFEIPVNTLTKDDAISLLKNTYEYYYDYDGYTESIRIRKSSAIGLYKQITYRDIDNKLKMCYSTSDVRKCADFLIKINKKSSLNFEAYWWSSIHNFAILVKGPFENRTLEFNS